jgi:hypothetical protein
MACNSMLFDVETSWIQFFRYSCDNCQKTTKFQARPRIPLVMHEDDKEITDSISENKRCWFSCKLWSTNGLLECSLWEAIKSISLVGDKWSFMETLKQICCWKTWFQKLNFDKHAMRIFRGLIKRSLPDHQLRLLWFWGQVRVSLNPIQTKAKIRCEFLCPRSHPLFWNSWEKFETFRRDVKNLPKNIESGGKLSNQHWDYLSWVISKRARDQKKLEMNQILVLDISPVNSKSCFQKNEFLENSETVHRLKKWNKGCVQI